ncbi:MAG: response regulator transcription factor [Gemmatimonadaceae bacterium]
MRILLVEDDPRTAESAAEYLRASGYAVDLASSGGDATRLAGMSPYDAVVLDLQLPDVDGVEVCRRLQRLAPRPRILMATARESVDDRIAGLDSGADDYLVKPYALGELVARLRALLRRPEAATGTVLRAGPLALDLATRRATRNGREIELTTKEFAVLETFLRHPGDVLTREHISEHAWDENYDPFSNVIDVYVARLRKKIDGPGEEPLLHTIRGAGYRLGEPAAKARVR